ncbi:MAG: DUF4346 domain-containing protein [archaeon]|nr:DUF4346 domain-containing protein [archaeon]
MSWIKGYTFVKNFKVVEQPPYDDIKDWVMDKGCYVIIRIVGDNIEVGVCDYKNNILEQVIAKRPQQIFHYLCNKTSYITRLDHAAYLGKELQKAKFAIDHKQKYVQDEELLIMNKEYWESS